jgi:inorganic phosphate transporter, PiT family
MAAVFNFPGAFISTNVAKTIGTDVASPSALTPVVVLAALVAAITWNLITWYYGIPSSSTHALIGGLIGAAVVFSPEHFGALKPAGIVKIVLSLILSPVAGLVLAFLVATVVVWLFRRSSPHHVTTTTSWLQRVSAAFVAFSHDSNDVQTTMGVITAAILAFEGSRSGGLAKQV